MGSLRRVGAQLSARGDLDRSRFVHESCLTGPPVSPQQISADLVRDALEQDAINLHKKYGSFEPSGGSARFNVTLPKGPQHTKYSIFGHTKEPDSVQRSLTKFNMQRLRDWFRDIDVNKSGKVSQRELLCALRQHQGIQSVFSLASGFDQPDAHRSRGGSAAYRRRDEVSRIKMIMHEVDDDSSGTMEWNEFVEFFRRAGLLLETVTC